MYFVQLSSFCSVFSTSLSYFYFVILLIFFELSCFLIFFLWCCNIVIFQHLGQIKYFSFSIIIFLLVLSQVKMVNAQGDRGNSRTQPL